MKLNTTSIHPVQHLLDSATPLTPRHRYSMNPLDNNNMTKEYWTEILSNPTVPFQFPPFTLAPLYNKAAGCWEKYIPVQSYHVIVEWINCLLQAFHGSGEEITTGIFEYQKERDLDLYDEHLFCIIHANTVVYFETPSTALELRTVRFDALVDIAESTAKLHVEQKRLAQMQALDHALTTAHHAHFKRMNGFAPFSDDTRRYQFATSGPGEAQSA